MQISKETECNCCGEGTYNVNLLQYKRIMRFDWRNAFLYTKAYIVCDKCRYTLSVEKIVEQADGRGKGRIVKYERFNEG